MRPFFLGLLLLCAATLAAAEVLFGATADRAKGGHLYAIDPATARLRDIGPIRIDGQGAVGVNGLAMHPTKHVLYGVTSEKAQRLVTIDPATAKAQVIGTLGAHVADINFDRNGRLYAWVPLSFAMGTIDLATGGLTLIELPGVRGGENGGIAIDGDGTAWIAATPDAGLIDTVDTQSRKRSGSLGLTGPKIVQVDALTVSAGRMMYGAVRDSGSARKLASIDLDSGALRLIGDLPDSLEGLALTPDASEAAAQRTRDKLNVLALLGIVVLVLVLFAIFRGRRSQRRPALP